MIDVLCGLFMAFRHRSCPLRDGCRDGKTNAVCFHFKGEFKSVATDGNDMDPVCLRTIDSGTNPCERETCEKSLPFNLFGVFFGFPAYD